MGEDCWPHATVCVRLYPDMDIAEIVVLFHGEEPTVRFKINHAASILEKKCTPKFDLPQEVHTCRSEGHEVFFELGVVTDEDLKRLTQVEGTWTGKALNLAALTECRLTLEQNSYAANVYFISLRGLPVDEILAMRRVKLTSSLQTVLRELHLSPQEMLSADHGTIQYEFQSNQKDSKHPKAWNPLSSVSPMTVEQITQKAQKFMEAAGTRDFTSFSRVRPTCARFRSDILES